MRNTKPGQEPHLREARVHPAFLEGGRASCHEPLLVSTGTRDLGMNRGRRGRRRGKRGRPGSQAGVRLLVSEEAAPQAQGSKRPPSDAPPGLSDAGESTSRSLACSSVSQICSLPSGDSEVSVSLLSSQLMIKSSQLRGQNLASRRRSTSFQLFFFFFFLPPFNCSL